MSKEEEVKKEETVIETKEETLQDYLKQIEESPSPEQIESWKEEHGEVLLFGFSEKEMFLFRPVRRGDYLGLQVEGQKQELTSEAGEELLLDHCVLWPEKVNWQETKAGTVTTLVEVIMNNSNFLSPQAATMLVAKL